MSRVIFLFITFLYAISLQKDEKFSLGFSCNNFKHKFTMWWTLYKNDVLTVVYFYDNFPRHITLYKDYPLNSFKVFLCDTPFPKPYLWVKFVDFKNNKVTFNIYIFNKNSVIPDSTKDIDGMF